MLKGQCGTVINSPIFFSASAPCSLLLKVPKNIQAAKERMTATGGGKGLGTSRFDRFSVLPVRFKKRR
jgi:hypothetical protein